MSHTTLTALQQITRALHPPQWRHRHALQLVIPATGRAYGSGGQAPASHSGGQASNQGQFLQLAVPTAQAAQSPASHSGGQASNQGQFLQLAVPTAQAVSHRLPTAVVKLRPRVNSCNWPCLRLRRSVTGFPQRWPGFDPGSIPATGRAYGSGGQPPASHSGDQASTPGQAGSVMDRALLRQAFSRYFGFLCQSFIPLTAPQSPYIIQGWYNRPINGRSNSGLGSTPVPLTNKKDYSNSC
jgi:hypothetical protein